jgi:hypothetical protein
VYQSFTSSECRVHVCFCVVFLNRRPVAIQRETITDAE